MKKALTLLLSLVLVFGVLAPVAYAAPAVRAVQPRYIRIGSFDTAFNINSNGKATCYASVESWYDTDTVDLTMELQRLEDGTWTTIKTWTGSGTHFTTLDKIWYVLTSYEHRIKVTAKIYNAAGVLLESQTEYHS